MSAVFSTAVLILTLAVTVAAQIAVRLKIDERTPAFSGQVLFCDEKFNCGLKLNEETKNGTIGENLRVRIGRSGDDFLFAADTDRDGSLDNEQKILIRRGSHILVRIQHTIAGRRLLLTYKVTHEREAVRGVLTDSFFASAQFTAAGKFVYKKCMVPIGLTDMDRNGRFDLADAQGGTNLGLDRNKDGKFWGREEYRRTNEIIDLCGKSFLVSSLNNSRIVFTHTTLRLARIDESVPDFTFRLMDGEMVTAKSLRGKPVVLDFWASWCVPCVEKLPEVKQLESELAGKVNVYSINVDAQAQRTRAERIIREKELRTFSAIRGLGDDDPFWKTFAGANLNRLSIPLYILIDRDGIVIYADNGGENLKGLKDSIAKTLVSPD